MNWRWLRNHWINLAGLAILAALAMAAPRLADYRGLPPERKAYSAFIVTSQADGGIGSLREALLDANRAPGRARIECRTDRITLETPLPPLINPYGLVIDARPGSCIINARGVDTVAVLEVHSPHSIIAGLTVTGASGAAVLVRSNAVHLDDLLLRQNDTGVLIAEGTSKLVIENSEFVANRLGISLSGNTAGLAITDNRFRAHETAALWAVAAKPPPATATVEVHIANNQFMDDMLSAVFINVPVRIEKNQFTRIETAAVYATGPGIVIQGNRMTQGTMFGIYADAVSNAVIEHNEVDANGAGGILIRYSESSTLRDNRLYRNRYGIIILFGDHSAPNLVLDNLVFSQSADAIYILGSSPVVQANRVRDSGQAALRIVDLIAQNGDDHRAEPVIKQNTFEKNTIDTPVREVVQAATDEDS